MEQHVGWFRQHKITHDHGEDNADSKAASEADDPLQTRIPRLDAIVADSAVAQMAGKLKRSRIIHDVYLLPTECDSLVNSSQDCFRLLLFQANHGLHLVHHVISSASHTAAGHAC